MTDAQQLDRPAPDAPAYVYRARVARVIDGDTFAVWIDLGFNAWAMVRLRLHGVDTPEVVGETRTAGRAAAAFAHDLLAPDDVLPYDSGVEVEARAAAPLLVRTYKDRRTFDRWEAEVYVRGPADASTDSGASWIDLGALMVAEGHAVPSEAR